MHKIFRGDLRYMISSGIHMKRTKDPFPSANDFIKHKRFAVAAEIDMINQSSYIDKSA